MAASVWMIRIMKLVECSQRFAQDWYCWRQQPLAVKFMPLKSDPVEALAERIQDSSSNLADHSANRYMWFIELEQAIVGMVGIVSVDWANGAGEITFIVDRAFHGRGIATSAVDQMLSKVFGETDLNRLRAIVSCGNVASEKVLRKLGFHHGGLLANRYYIQDKLVDQCIFTLSRSEWINHNRSFNSFYKMHKM